MELKGRHLYGVTALAVGVVALVFAGISRVINQAFDTPVQAGLAIGLLSLALFAWLELDLISAFLKTRQAKFGAMAVAYSVLIIIVVGSINYIFSKFDRLKGEWDLTAAKENSLAPETLTTLSNLKDPVKVVAFYTPGFYSRQTGEDLLKKFRDKGNGNLGYEVVDPISQPALAQKYGVTTDGTLVVIKGDRHENAKYADESELVNAIVRLENPIQFSVYFLTGHGERSPDSSDKMGYSQVKTYLENINYKVKTLESLANAVPVDASVMVIAGPTRPYSQQEVDNLGKYLSGGGKVIFMIDPSLLGGLAPGQTDLLVDYLTKNWGITLRDDVVLDPQKYVPGADITFPVAGAYASSPIISADIQTVSSFFPFTRSIELAASAPEGVSNTSVVTTSNAAWGETNLEVFKGTSGQKVEANPEDAQGELTLLATGENTTTKAQVVVVGDSQLAVNAYWSAGANLTIFLNSVKWMTEQENLVTISPKPIADHPLTVSSRDLWVIFLLACLLPPVVVAVAGVSVWWSRRRSA